MRRFLTLLALLTLLLAGPAGQPGTIGAAPARAQSDQPDGTRPSQADGSASSPTRDAEAEANKVRQRRFQYLMLGYGLIWVSLGFYLFDLNRKVSRVGSDIEELKGRLDVSRNRQGR